MPKTVKPSTSAAQVTPTPPLPSMPSTPTTKTTPETPEEIDRANMPPPSTPVIQGKRKVRENLTPAQINAILDSDDNTYIEDNLFDETDEDDEDDNIPLRNIKKEHDETVITLDLDPDEDEIPAVSPIIKDDIRRTVEASNQRYQAKKTGPKRMQYRAISDERVIDILDEKKQKKTRSRVTQTTT